MFVQLLRQSGQNCLPDAQLTGPRNSSHWRCAPATLPSLDCTTLQISFTFSMAIKSSTSKVNPKVLSRLLARFTCPMESHAGTSSGEVSRVMVLGSTSNADLKAVCTFVNSSSMMQFPSFSLSNVIYLFVRMSAGATRLHRLPQPGTHCHPRTAI